LSSQAIDFLKGFGIEFDGVGLGIIGSLLGSSRSGDRISLGLGD
jgi:hypothetical protein